MFVWKWVIFMENRILESSTKTAGTDNNKGFTMAEMLITILIMLMVSSIMAAGIPVAANALKKVVDTANAHALLSTTMTCLRDELSTAEAASITVSPDEKTIAYTTSDGSRSIIRSQDDGIWLYPYQDFYPLGGDDENPYQRLLVSLKASNENLHAEAKFSYVAGIVTVKGLEVKKGTARIVEIKDTDGFQIRVITWRKPA